MVCQLDRKTGIPQHRFEMYHPLAGATAQLLNSTVSAHEGAEIVVCAEFVSNGRDLTRPFLVAVSIFDGSANCKITLIHTQKTHFFSLL